MTPQFSLPPSGSSQKATLYMAQFLKTFSWLLDEATEMFIMAPSLPTSQDDLDPLQPQTTRPSPPGGHREGRLQKGGSFTRRSKQSNATWANHTSAMKKCLRPMSAGSSRRLGTWEPECGCWTVPLPLLVPRHLATRLLGTQRPDPETAGKEAKRLP